MDEAETRFWEALEYRVCIEFSGFDDEELRHYWCDGLVPDQYEIEADEPCIRGTAFCGRTGQERWRFTLLIGAKASTAAAIDWASLLPDPDTTRWLSPHRTERFLILHPIAASRS